MFYASPLALTATARMLPAAEIPWGAVVAELVGMILLVVLIFLFKNRFWKILAACAAEICLFFVCKQIFGDESLVTKILCWVTAAVACLATISIVNLVNWNALHNHHRS